MVNFSDRGIRTSNFGLVPDLGSRVSAAPPVSNFEFPSDLAFWISLPDSLAKSQNCTISASVLPHEAGSRRRERGRPIEKKPNPVTFGHARSCLVTFDDRHS